MKYSGLRNFLISAILLVFSMSSGILGFSLIEGYTLLDSVYMTVITLSTVGFNLVEPLSDSGKIFASVYILFNIGIFAYIVSTITTYLFEGELEKVFKKFVTGREVKRYKDHVIVCGYGRQGSKVCDELKKSDTPFIIIEKESQLLEQSRGERKVTIVGDATLDETLMEAGIDRAKALITTLPHDADNVFITLTVKELNPAIYIISRASDLNAEKKLLRAGANRVVLPDILGGIFMANLITKPYVVDFLEILNGLGNSMIKLEDCTFDQLKEEFRHKTLKELNIREKTGATVLGIKSLDSGFVFRPNSETIISERDVLILLGSEENLKRFSSFCK